MQKVALLGTDIGIVEGLVNLHRLRLDVLTILVIQALLGNLTDVNLGVEVGSKCLVVITSIAVNDIQVLNLLEVMLGSISCIDTGYAGVETTPQDGAKTSPLETLAVSPLPAVFKVSLILRLVVGGIHIVTTCLQASLHDGEVLIRQSQVDNQLGFVGTHKLDQLLYAISIHLSSLNLCAILLVQHISQVNTFLFCTTGNHHLCEHITVLAYLVCSHCGYTASTDNKYSSHSIFYLLYFRSLEFSMQTYKKKSKATKLWTHFMFRSLKGKVI